MSERDPWHWHPDAPRMGCLLLLLLGACTLGVIAVGWWVRTRG